MKISRLRFSAPIFLMLTMQSGSAMDLDIDQIIYDIEHGSMRPIEHALKYYPECVHVRKKEDLPKNLPEEGKIKTKLITFLKEKGRSDFGTNLEGIKFLQQKKNDGMEKVKDSEVLKYLEDKGISVNKETFSDEFRECVQYANDYYPEDKTDDLPVPLKRTTEDIVAEYLKNHTIATNPTTAKLCEVIALLNELAKPVPNEQKKAVTTDTEGIKGIFANKEEMDDFVEYMQREKEVSDKIKIEKTEKEKIIDGVDKYVKYVEGNTGKEIPNPIRESLEKLAEDLVKEGKPMDVIESFANIATNAAAIDVTLNFDSFVKFIDYLRDAGVNVSKPGDKERIAYEVNELYAQSGSPKVGDLTKEQAYDLAMYMRNQDGKDTPTVITSDITKTNTVESIKGKTITDKDLGNFVTDLNTKEAAAQKGALNVIVETTDAEKVDYAVDAYILSYLPSHSIIGLQVGTDNEKAATKTTLKAIVAYLENPGKDPITSDDVKANVAGLSGSDISNKDLEKLKECLNDQGKNLAVTIERTDVEKVNDAVTTYMETHSNIPGQTEAVLKEIVSYLRNPGKDSITSDDVKDDLVTKGIIANKNALTLDYQNLNSLKDCLAHEDITLTVGINKTVDEMNTEERIKHEIEGYLKNHTIESMPNKTVADKTALCNVVTYLKSLGSTATVTTDNIYKNTAVTFTYEELDEFVKYLKEKNEIPEGIKVKRTTKENAGEYLKTHNITSLPKTTQEEIETAKAKLSNVVEILNQKANDSPEANVIATTDDVKEEVVFKHEELNEFVTYMQGAEVDEVSDKIKVEMTTAERIGKEVSEYYIPPEGSQATAQTVGNLTKEQAYDLAMYMRNQDGKDTPTVITSDITKTNTVKSINGKTITHQNLVDFVKHLNTEEKAAGKNTLNVEVEKTYNEQLMFDIGEYLSNTTDQETAIADTPETRNALSEVISQYLKDLNTDTVVTTAGIAAAAVAAGVVLNLTYPQLEALVNSFMGKDGVPEGIKVEMTTAERIKKEVSEYYTPPEGSQATAQTVGNLTKEQAYALAMYMRELTDETPITSASVLEALKKADENFPETASLNYENLNAFVEYLNTEETTAGKGALNVTVEKTDSEKIDSAIKAYYKGDHVIIGLSNDDAKAALVEIAKHLKTLPSNWKTNSSTIMKELQATTPPKIPSTVNLTYEDMVAYIEALNAENFGLNITIVEEELTLRQKIDLRLKPETPKDKLAEVVYDSYRLDSLLDKDGDIVADDVKNTWADAITASFMLALPDTNSSILKQDSTIQPAIAAAAEAETQSRIATTTDGSIPSTLKTDIENYVDALYEAKSDAMNTSLNSILSSENNKLKALMTTEKKSEINSGILTDVTADNNAMTTKTNDVFADLKSIKEAVRRYSVMYEIKQTDLQNKVLSDYDPSTGGPKAILRDASTNKIVQNVDNSLGRDYLITYLRYNYCMVEENDKYPNAVSQILTDIKTVDKTDPREKVNYAVEDLIRKHYVQYMVDTTDKASNATLYTYLKNRVLHAFWSTKWTDEDDNEVMNLSTEAQRIWFIRKGMYKSSTINDFNCLRIQDPANPTGTNNCTAILNRIKQNKRSEIESILNQDFIPLAAKQSKSTFTTPIIDRFFEYYGTNPNMKPVHVSDIYLDKIVKYLIDYAWVPHIDIRDEIIDWQSYVAGTWTNSNIPASITTDIRTNIQNALKNLGSGKTLKAGLKNHLNVDGTKALVNDENEWPVANGTPEIDKKYNYTASNKDMVNILDYTYDQLIGDVRAIDAKTAYGVLKAKADATNEAAIDSLVSSNLRNEMKTAIANVTTPADVQSAASPVLLSEIVSKKESTSDDVKDKYARIYRSVNLGANNTVDLSEVTDEASVKAAFDTTIYNSIKDYIYPDQINGNFNGINNGVTGFVDAVYGSNDDAKTAAIRQVAMNWITARGNEFKAAEIAEMLNDIKVTRNPGDRLKYQVEAYLSSHNIASLLNKTNEDKENLVKAVKHLQGLDENATVMTTNITDVEFTFPELKAFVDYFKGKEGIKDTISAVKTEEQKLDSAFETYYPSHNISGLSNDDAKAALTKIANYLKELDDNTTIKSSTVMAALKSGDSPIPNEVNLSHDDLEAYVAALNAENFGLKNITIAEEEDTLRGEINTLVADYVPTVAAESTNFNDTVFNTLIDQKKSGGDAITEEDVRTAWTAQIQGNLNEAKLWKKDSAVEQEVSNNVNTALNSRIATTDDGKVPDSLASDIDDYLNALYEANSADMESALDSLLSEKNNLSALNTDTNRSAIDSGILTDVTANGDAMNAKTNSVYTDLPEIVEAIRRYAVMYDITKEDVITYFLNNYTDSSPDIYPFLLDYLSNKTINSVSEGRDYLSLYMRYWNFFDSSSPKMPSEMIDSVFTKARRYSQGTPLEKVNSALHEVLGPYYATYLAKDEDNASKLGEGTVATSAYRAIVAAYRNNENGTPLNLSDDNERRHYLWLKTYVTKGIDVDKYYMYLSDSDQDSILNYLKSGNNSGISTILNKDIYIPLAIRSNSTLSTAFKEDVYDTLLSEYNSRGDGMNKPYVASDYISVVTEYCITKSWVPSVDIRDEIIDWQSYVAGTWTNSNINDSTASTVKANIQNALKNLGSGKKLKAGLKSYLGVSGTSALVNDENEWPVANGTSEIDKKYNYTVSNKDMVNILDYTYDKIIGKVRATDAITTYGVLKDQADSKLGSAVGGLVPSGKVNDMKSEIKTAQSEVDVADAVCSLLEDSKSNADAQNYVARIYRGRKVNSDLGVVGNNFKDMIDANIAYDTLKYLRHDMTLDNVMNIIINVKNFVNKLDGTDEEKSEAISSAINDALNGFPAKDIADIINRII